MRSIQEKKPSVMWVSWQSTDYFFINFIKFGLTKIAPIQNTDLTNAKYNNTLSGIYNNTLYDTINTNRLNIFTFI